MKGKVSHDRREESIEAKTRWFRSLTVEERMELLCEFTDLALAANPGIVHKRDDQPTTGRVQILSKK